MPFRSCLLQPHGVNTSSRNFLRQTAQDPLVSIPHRCYVPPWHSHGSQGPFALQPHNGSKQHHMHQTQRSDHDGRCVPRYYNALYARNLGVDQDIKLKLIEQQSVPASPRVQQTRPEAVSSGLRKASAPQPASTLPEAGLGPDTSSHSERNRCGQV